MIEPRNVNSSQTILDFNPGTTRRPKTRSASTKCLTFSRFGSLSSAWSPSLRHARPTAGQNSWMFLRNPADYSNFGTISLEYLNADCATGSRPKKRRFGKKLNGGFLRIMRGLVCNSPECYVTKYTFRPIIQVKKSTIAGGSLLGPDSFWILIRPGARQPELNWE
jgi:hypothetical protein